MYLFEGGNCIFCMPEQTNLTYPPEKYTEELLDQGKRISYCTTKYGIFFCSLKVDHLKNGALIFGPVTNIPYTESDLQQLYRDYTVPNNDRTDFNSFLRQIPCLSMNSLLKKCLFLNYCIHEELLTLEHLTASESDASMQISLTDACSHLRHEELRRDCGGIYERDARPQRLSAAGRKRGVAAQTML